MDASRFNRLAPRLLFIVVFSLLSLALATAQNTPVFRIGVIAEFDSPLALGTQLAVDEINASGGVVGADGTRFALQTVVQDPSDIAFAVSNINQASVIAVIGPEDDETAQNNAATLAQLNVPILTTATNDALILNDATDLFFRLRAQEAVQGRALANYLIGDLGAASMVTVQLDLESGTGVLGFSRAAQQQGLTPSSAFVLADGSTVESIASEIRAASPQFVVTYGAADVAVEFYNALQATGFAGRFVYENADDPAFRAALQLESLASIIGVSTWSVSSQDATSEDFTLAYLRQYGEIPDEIAAAAYDGVYLLQEAIGQPGSLNTNLLAIRDFAGVQGDLSPALLVPGEMSSNVYISELGDYGAPNAVARYEGIQRIELASVEEGAVSTPTPVAIPTLAIVPTATPDSPFLTVTRAVQNVRTGPGLNYDILGQLPEGSTAPIIGANIDFSWVAIEFRGTTGWLSQGILDVTGSRNVIPLLTPPPSPTPIPATATPSPAPIPDLVVTTAAPTRITIGVPFNVTATIANQGGSGAGQFAVAASFEPGGVYSAVTLAGLGAGQSTNVTFSGVLSGATGPQDVTIVADLNNQVNEGAAGEANNSNYILNYIADAPLLTTAQASGQLTLADLGTTSLDGGTQDIQWGGGGLVPLGTTQLVRLTNFTDFNNVHRDAIAAAALQNVPVTPVTSGMLIGVLTDGGNKHGVLQVISATGGGQIIFNYRMYDN